MLIFPRLVHTCDTLNVDAGASAARVLFLRTIRLRAVTVRGHARLLALRDAVRVILGRFRSPPESLFELPAAGGISLAAFPHLSDAGVLGWHPQQNDCPLHSY